MTTGTIFFSGSTMTNAQKWWSAIFLGLLFFLFSLPAVYGFVGGAMNGVTKSTWNFPGGPSIGLIVVHSIIFALVVRLLMW